MPKFKENTAQIKEAYQLWNERIHTQKTILEHLQAKYKTHTVTSRTISRWIKEFNLRSLSENEQDKKYEWRLLNKYEIPWQDGKLANYLNSEHYHQTGTMATGRQVKWLWRAWHASDGANLTPKDDIQHFWRNLIKQANTESKREENDIFYYSLNLKGKNKKDIDES
ncbi:hypothetical protein OAJ44_00650 [Chloroflexi bacterium]|nr:hypothetical protein [Chloroflexota bacterium]